MRVFTARVEVNYAARPNCKHSRGCISSECHTGKRVRRSLLEGDKPAVAGRDKVLTGWRMIFRGKNQLDIRISNVRVATVGNMAFLTCEEHVGTDDRKGHVTATNVFERQGDSWKIVHHHGSIVSPAMKPSP
jgi:ketosteroid isomerase-like protein